MKHFIIAILIFLSACKPAAPTVPSKFIQPDKMKMVLSDMFIADAISSNRAMGGTNEKQFTSQYYATIYKNYGITQDEFAKSYKFYEDNPVLLNKLYDEVLGEISKREAVVGK